MLELTITEGTELIIGGDVKIKFRGMMSGRVKVAVEAPKEKRIERVKPESALTAEGEGRSNSVHAGSDRGKVFIVRNNSIG